LGTIKALIMKLFGVHIPVAWWSKRGNQHGFTLIEIVAACAVFPILVIGIANAYNTARIAYTRARQLNEIYAVLSACPEMDRALEYNSLTSGSNCFPNNTFQVEGDSNLTVTYAPTLTTTDTTALGNTDPLKSIPDSKVISIDVGYPRSTAPHLQLRMLVTRNGIGQL
jgi:prepilin-type N-terminal cleavage/methylation domain-containing protein